MLLARGGMLKQGKHSVGPFLMQCNVGVLTLCLSTSYVTSRATPFAQIHPLSRTCDRLSPRNRGPTRSRKCTRCLKKNTVSYCRPTGRLDPTPADLAYGSVDLAALEYRARRGEIILLYEDETILWRFALPRLGWWRRAQRPRLPTRPLSQSQIKRAESLKRQAWVRYRSWSRVTSGVLLSVIGAVQYGTSQVFYKLVPHFDAQELRQYIHQVMATFQKTEKEVVMVVDRSGIHRAHTLDATRDHYHDKFRSEERRVGKE